MKFFTKHPSSQFSRPIITSSRQPLKKLIRFGLFFLTTISFLNNSQAQGIPGKSGSIQAGRIVNFTQLAAQEAAAPSTKNVGKAIIEVHLPQDLPLPSNATVIKDPYGVINNKANAPPADIQPNSPAPALSFAALGDNGTFIPPDTHGAAGPNHLMTTLNSQVRIQTRTGAIISTVTLRNFFFGNTVFDPKVNYDPYGGRWILVVALNPQSTSSGLMLAVSTTNDPTGSWFIYTIDLEDGMANINWFDYPSVGFNKNWIVVQGNRFANSNNAFKGTRIFAFNKTEFYTGGSVHWTFWDRTDIGGTQSPAITYSTSLNEEYLLQNWNGNFSGSGYIRLYTISGAVGSETFTDGPFISTPNPWASGGTGAPQLGDPRSIDDGDARMMNVIYRNGYLWSTHSIYLSSPTRSSIQWWQVTPVGAIQQRGRIDDAGGTYFHAYPSISVNSTDDALIGYSRFSAGQYASANYSFRVAGDALNTTQPSYTFKVGEAPYFKDYGSGANRWGDYSATVVDPVNDQDFWTIQEYAATPSNFWGTWWAKVSKVSPPTITSFLPVSGPAGVGVYIKGTNFILNGTIVRFNGVTATQIYYSSSTQLYATVPAGATTGKIQVETQGGSALSASNFTVAPIVTKWVTKTGLTTARIQHGTIATSGKIYVFCGRNVASVFNSLEIYNPSSNTWSAGTPMPVGRRGMAVALGSDGLIYSFGGIITSTAVSTTYRYTPSTDTWLLRASMPVKLFEAAAAATSNGKIYVFGGEPSTAIGTSSKATYIYTIATNTWTTGANMPVGVRQHSAITGADGRIYIIGGRAFTANPPLGLVQIYNPTTNTWASGAAMPIPLVQFGAVKASDNKIYVIGGKAKEPNSNGPFFHTVLIYNTATNSWTSTGPVIPRALGQQTAVSLNGNLYAIGGTDDTIRNYNFQLILPPSAPSALTALAVSSSQINLKWSDNALNETGYTIQRATAAAGPWASIALVAANTTTYSNTGLAAHTIYYYRVKGTNSAGSSAYSNVAKDTTFSTTAPIGSANNGPKDQISISNNLSVEPDPVHTSANIRFSVGSSQQALVGIYDMNGNLIQQLYNGHAEAGRVYVVAWNAGSHASGTYVSRLITPNGILTKKFILAR